MSWKVSILIIMSNRYQYFNTSRHWGERCLSLYIYKQGSLWLLGTTLCRKDEYGVMQRKYSKVQACFVLEKNVLQNFAIEGFVKACPVGLNDSYKKKRTLLYSLSLYIYIMSIIQDNQLKGVSFPQWFFNTSAEFKTMSWKMSTYIPVLQANQWKMFTSVFQCTLKAEETTDDTAHPFPLTLLQRNSERSHRNQTCTHSEW